MDQDYISKEKEEMMAKQELRFIAKVKRNMKLKPFTVFERYFFIQARTYRNRYRTIKIDLPD